jgi:Ca-activated chloride channel family protein
VALAALLAAAVAPGRAGAQETGQEPKDDCGNRTLSPYFFVEGESPGTEAFPLKRTEVVANVSGVIADVTVRQSYENRGNVPIHARYVFPGSTRAAVHGMRFRIGERSVVAKSGSRPRRRSRRRSPPARARRCSSRSARTCSRCRSPT